MKKAIYSFYQRICISVIKHMALQAGRKGRIDEEWKKILFLAAEDRPSIHTYKMLKGFMGEKIILKKRAASWDDPETPAILCVEKNSLTYMKYFIPYYRELGVGHFIFIDNGSSDGTEAFLQEQGDVTLYTAPYPFENHRKAGWLLQALQEAGTARWYLRLDADEFLSWEGMEGSSVPELILKMEQHGMGTFRAIMTDMYPSYSLMDGTHEDDRFMEDFIYFDDASSFRLSSETDEIFGGMRSRTTGADLRMDKYVIFRPDRGYIPLTNHNMTGIRNDEERKCRGILRHYKFLPSEGEKYRHISMDKKSGYSGFKQVSKYRKLVDEEINALSDHSIRYDSSVSIQKLDLVDPL